MERLTYIQTSDVTVDIDLHNSYCVRTDAKYNPQTKRYDAKFYLKENSIEKYTAIHTLNNDSITFDGNRKTIKVDILKYISHLLSENYFASCIQDFEYEIKCFDKGNEFLEEEKNTKKESTASGNSKND